MEAMRTLLKRSLGRSLAALPELDRLQAAWTVACGPALAGRGTVTAYAEGTVTVVVDDPLWLEQMRSMRPVLEREVAVGSGLPVCTIHFEAKGSRP